MAKETTYKDAGVNIEAGNQAVELIKGYVKSTKREGVLGDIGGFGGSFALNMGKYEEPILVSGTDGVGTKLRLAFLLDKHDTIGIDAVAMCVNDILVQGAEPLFFLDYLAVGKLVPEKVAEIVKGVAAGCRLAGCALVGGETAEMPGFYPEDEYDVAGFSVGIVDKRKIIDGSNIAVGDKVLGLASSGLHSNGFSLVRKIFIEDQNCDLNQSFTNGKTLGETLLEPTRIYVRSILHTLESVKLKGMAHITGGGLTENIPRVLPEGVDAKLDLNSWELPLVFKEVQRLGNVPQAEMLKTFNMGIGMAVIVAPEDEERARQSLEEQGEKVYQIGEIVTGNRKVVYNV